VILTSGLSSAAGSTKAPWWPLIFHALFGWALWRW
jgi:hypothetical protein